MPKQISHWVPVLLFYARGKMVNRLLLLSGKHPRKKILFCVVSSRLSVLSIANLTQTHTIAAVPPMEIRGNVTKPHGIAQKRIGIVRHGTITPAT